MFTKDLSCARHGVEKLVMKKLQKYENMFIMQHNAKCKTSQNAKLGVHYDYSSIKYVRGSLVLCSGFKGFLFLVKGFLSK